MKITIFNGGILHSAYIKDLFPAIKKIIEHLDYTTVGIGLAFIGFVGLGLIC